MQANFTPPRSLRGGIPICFPQVRVSYKACMFWFIVFSLSTLYYPYAVLKFWYS